MFAASKSHNRLKPSSIALNSHEEKKFATYCKIQEEGLQSLFALHYAFLQVE